MPEGWRGRSALLRELGWVGYLTRMRKKTVCPTCHRDPSVGGHTPEHHEQHRQWFDDLECQVHRGWIDPDEGEERVCGGVRRVYCHLGEYDYFWRCLKCGDETVREDSWARERDEEDED